MTTTVEEIRAGIDRLFAGSDRETARHAILEIEAHAGRYANVIEAEAGDDVDHFDDDDFETDFDEDEDDFDFNDEDGFDDDDDYDFDDDFDDEE